MAQTPTEIEATHRSFRIASYASGQVSEHLDQVVKLVTKATEYGGPSLIERAKRIQAEVDSLTQDLAELGGK